MSLKIDVLPVDSDQPHTARVVLDGRLDSNTYKALEKAMEPVLSGPAKIVILDLAKLQFISSAGIRVLILAQKALAQRSGSLLMIHMQPQITKVLEIINALPGVSIFRSSKEMDDYLTVMQNRVLEKDLD